MNDTNDLRREIQDGLAKAGLNHSVLSVELGRSKDYIGDFLRGNKDTLGHKEILAIRARISSAVSDEPTQDARDKTSKPGNPDIHIELAAFREALFALLRTLNVAPVLARSRIDDLLEDLRSLSTDQSHRSTMASLRIDSGSGGRASADPDEPPSDR